MTIDAVLFDKDGTLFDFRASWSGWLHDLVIGLAAGDRACAKALAVALGYDMAARDFAPDSIVIAGTSREAAEVAAPVLSGWSVDALQAHLEAAAANVSMVPAVPLIPLLTDLRTHVAHLGVATNASAAEATAHLHTAGLGTAFDFVAGCDSGFGAKPGPGMCTAFADAVGLAPGRIVMVGDSLHDLRAGRDAGMRVVAVLTGLATRADLAPHADAVLDDIGALPAWLAAERSPG